MHQRLLALQFWFPCELFLFSRLSFFCLRNRPSLCCLRYALAELNRSFWRLVQRKRQKPCCQAWGLRLVRRSSLLYLECKISLLCSWAVCLAAFAFPRFCR